MKKRKNKSQNDDLPPRAYSLERHHKKLISGAGKNDFSPSNRLSENKNIYFYAIKIIFVSIYIFEYQLFMNHVIKLPENER